MTTRKTDGGKGDRIPGADQAAYEAGYAGINWNSRNVPTLHGDAPQDGGSHGAGQVQQDAGEGIPAGPGA